MFIDGFPNLSVVEVAALLVCCCACSATALSADSIGSARDHLDQPLDRAERRRYLAAHELALERDAHCGVEELLEAAERFLRVARAARAA